MDEPDNSLFFFFFPGWPVFVALLGRSMCLGSTRKLSKRDLFMEKSTRAKWCKNSQPWTSQVTFSLHLSWSMAASLSAVGMILCTVYQSYYLIRHIFHLHWPTLNEFSYQKMLALLGRENKEGKLISIGKLTLIVVSNNRKYNFTITWKSYMHCLIPWLQWILKQRPSNLQLHPLHWSASPSSNHSKYQ